MKQRKVAPGPHWLLRWADEFDVITADDAVTRLRYPRAIERLYKLARKSPTVDEISIPSKGSVVAGPGMDHAYSNCTAPSCRIPIIENEFGYLLQFFDRIVMEGPSAEHYVRLIEGSYGTADGYLAQSLHQDVTVLLYMREMGLTKYTVFANKPGDVDEPSFRRCAEALDMDWVMFFPQRESTAEWLSRTTKVKLVQLGPEHWYGYVSSPLYGGVQGAHFSGKQRPKKYEVIDQILLRLGLNLITDVATSQTLKLPLAPLTQPAFFSESSEPSRQLSADDVALALSVPSLTGVGTRSLIALREEESDHFEGYRVALRSAIKNAVAAHSGSSPSEVAEVVLQDSLLPAVADINRKLESSKRALLRSAATGVSVGSIMVGIGALSSIPWLVTAGMAAAATPLVETYKYFGGRQTLETAEMYFLWKAMRKHEHR